VEICSNSRGALCVQFGVRGMMLNATFDNSSVISWRWREPEKTTDLPQVTDKLYHIILWYYFVSSTSRHDRYSNSQRMWWYALFSQVVINQTSIRSRPIQATDTNFIIFGLIRQRLKPKFYLT